MNSSPVDPPGKQTEHLITVTSFVFDCLDHTTRQRCKHVLAVQLAQGQTADVLRMASVLADP